MESLSDAQVLDRMRELVRVQHEAEVRLVALVDQASRRGLAQSFGCKNVVQLLRQVLNLGAGEAAVKVRLAAAVSPRHMLSGEVVAPLHPETAAAFTAGEVSARSADIVTRTVDRLPACVLEEAHSAVEAVLLDFARAHDPETLARHATRVAAALDQDGALRDHEQAARQRSVDLHRFPDGSGLLTARLTAEAAEYVHTVLDSLGRPKPAEENGARDLRTPGQRRHDALLTGLKLLLSSGRLPKAGGCATTVILTMTVDELATDSGVATTGHGYPVPVALAKRWLDPEAKAILVLLSKTRGIAAYCDKQRLFTEQQRLAMLARDGGCSYPGCDATLAWLDAHHVTDCHHQPHHGRRRRPGLRPPPRHLRNHGLDLHHAQRPTPLDPTPPARPAANPQTQPPARPEVSSHPVVRIERAADAEHVLVEDVRRFAR